LEVSPCQHASLSPDRGFIGLVDSAGTSSVRLALAELGSLRERRAAPDELDDLVNVDEAVLRECG
jgi:hypothetical protein